MRIIDSHCHLEGNVADQINAAKAVGVDVMLSVACERTDLAKLTQILDDYSDVYGAFGIHPQSAENCPSANDLAALFIHPKLIGVGETGLDYHYAPETRDIQITAFERHIDVSKSLNKPIIVHTREADSDTLSVLRAGQVHRGVIHCFTGDMVLAHGALDMGFYISAAGILTFPKAQDLRNVFATIPLDRLLVETDAPYLAPVPYRGKPNQPAWVVETLKCLANLHNISAEEMANITTHNFEKLFNI